MLRPVSDEATTEALTEGLAVVGTLPYMSPEELRGERADHRSDLYSLGVTTFELVTGRVPFQTGNVPYHHVHTPPPDPREINPQVPSFLAGIILRCLEKDPEDRYENAQDLLSELARATRDSTVTP